MANEPCVICGKVPDEFDWVRTGAGLICEPCQAVEWRKMMQSYEAMVDAVQKGMAKESRS